MPPLPLVGRSIEGRDERPVFASMAFSEVLEGTRRSRGGRGKEGQSNLANA